MSAGPLFDRSAGLPRATGTTTLPYTPGSDTSKRAAKAVEGRAPSIRARVYRFILNAGERGATADEIVAAAGHSHHSTIATRVSELKADGYLEIVGERPTRTGEMAEVYVALPGGPGKTRHREPLRAAIARLEKRLGELEKRVGGE